MLIDTANAITNTLSTHTTTESMPFTEQSHRLHSPSGTDANGLKRRDDNPALGEQQQYQTTTPFRHRPNEVDNDGNGIDVAPNGNDDAHIDDDNDSMLPALAQPQIQATRKATTGGGAGAAVAAMAAKPTKTKPWKIKHILIETSLTALCVFFLLIALVICTIFSWKQTTHRMSTALATTSSNHYCDKSNLISSSSECEMDFSSSTTSIISQSTVMHV